MPENTTVFSEYIINFCCSFLNEYSNIPEKNAARDNIAAELKVLIDPSTYQEIDDSVFVTKIKEVLNNGSSNVTRLVGAQEHVKGGKLESRIRVTISLLEYAFEEFKKHNLLNIKIKELLDNLPTKFEQLEAVCIKRLLVDYILYSKKRIFRTQYSLGNDVTTRQEDNMLAFLRSPAISLHKLTAINCTLDNINFIEAARAKGALGSANSLLEWHSKIEKELGTLQEKLTASHSSVIGWMHKEGYSVRVTNLIINNLLPVFKIKAKITTIDWREILIHELPHIEMYLDKNSANIKCAGSSSGV